jgi:hypothetical protein
MIYTRIYVKTINEGHRLQKILFESGYKWRGIGDTITLNLYDCYYRLDSDNEITWDSNGEEKWCSVDEYIAMTRKGKIANFLE